MITRITLVGAWIGLATAPILLAVGHLGVHNLRWTQDQISTYAALAPHGDWITAGMLLSALTFLCLGLLLPTRLGARTVWLSQHASMTFGVTVAGLLVLASYKETAMTIEQLKQLGFAAVRQQSFHDAGLLLFFYSAALGMMIAGVTLILEGPRWARRLLGGVVVAIGPAAFFALALSWPVYIGFSDVGAGFKQRAAFLCLWLGALVLLSLVTKKATDNQPC